MALPIATPARVFYSQRVDGRPYVNCLPYSICSALAFMGYDVPKDYGMQMRQASGVPMGEHRGTSFADMRARHQTPVARCANRVWRVDEGGLLNLLASKKRPNRKNVVAFTASMERMPRHLRRHCGYTWEGWPRADAAWQGAQSRRLLECLSDRSNGQDVAWL